MPKKTGEAKKRDDSPKDLLGAIQKVSSTQYIAYDVCLSIRNFISGGAPKLLEMTYAMIEARVKKGILTEEEADRIRTETVERYNEMYRSIRKKEAEEKGDSVEESDEEETSPEVSDAAKQAVEAHWTTILSDEYGLYVEARTIKAAIRECHSVLGTFVKGKKDRKKSGHNDGTYVDGIDDHVDRVYLRRDGKILTEPDQSDDVVVHLKTAQGPRSALKRVDRVLGSEHDGAGCDIRFRLKLHVESGIKEEDLIAALALLQDRGIGAMASTGSGKCEVTEFKRIGAVSA